MARHGSGVAEAKVNVFAAIHVGKMRAFGGLDEDGESASPFFHPVHGDAAEEGGLSACVERGGFWMVGEEAGIFTLLQGFQFIAVDGGHLLKAPRTIQKECVRLRRRPLQNTERERPTARDDIHMRGGWA